MGWPPLLGPKSKLHSKSSYSVCPVTGLMQSCFCIKIDQLAYYIINLIPPLLTSYNETRAVRDTNEGLSTNTN